jgi:hypothetical protein
MSDEYLNEQTPLAEKKKMGRPFGAKQTSKPLKQYPPKGPRGRPKMIPILTPTEARLRPIFEEVIASMKDTPIDDCDSTFLSKIAVILNERPPDLIPSNGSSTGPIPSYFIHTIPSELDQCHLAAIRHLYREIGIHKSSKCAKEFCEYFDITKVYNYENPAEKRYIDELISIDKYEVIQCNSCV